MREPARDRGPMRRRSGDRGDRIFAGGGLVAAEVEFALVGVYGAGVIIGAGVGARRMARDQIVDFQTILDRADAILDRAASPAVDWAMARSFRGA